MPIGRLMVVTLRIRKMTAVDHNTGSDLNML